MRKMISRQQDSEELELNMASLIDMIFILLIFFLVTTSFVKEAGVEVQRPVASSAQTKEKTNMVLAVTHEGTIWAEGRTIDIRSVRACMERFLSETPKGSVVIAADKDSRTGTVIQVLDACRLAGVKNVSVAARRP
ncbi:biopolymer transporter ExbD [uncultured Desulfobacter sp.]|uniref:ExbD/TolR family protein n=1 Tax=uncultured Desulfobacter sp. TaxID=240139 RepID=UPI002AABB203|nr:biopolymer transporter ExbD [uncultured Desulfobacter sp.]